MPDTTDLDGDNPSRIGLAADRTMLASERTLAAWWRTALAALAAAVGFAKIAGDIGPPWLPRLAAMLPILLAGLVLFVAARRYVQTARRVEAECVERVPTVELWLGTGLLAALAVAVTVLVWAE